MIFEKNEKAPLLMRLEKRNWMILLGMLLLSLPLLSFKFSLGILTGAILSIFSFYSLYRVVKRAILKPAGRAREIVIFWYYLRIFSIGFIIYLLISNGLVNPIGLILGLSVVVLNVIFTTIKDFRRILLEV